MPGATKRERDLPVVMSFPGIYIEGSGEQFRPPSTVNVANGRQITVSEGHQFDQKLGRYDSGGPFYTSRFSYKINPVDIDGVVGASNRIYSGPCYCPPPTEAECNSLGFFSNFNQLGSENKDLLNTSGATAISRCSPVNPASNLGTGLTENLHEGLPHVPGIRLWKDKTLRAKNAADEYLNQVFGWLPLVGEINDVVKVARNTRDILKAYHDNEGSDVHRTYNFPSEHTSSSGSAHDGNAVFPNWETSMLSAAHGATRTVSRVSETKRWFSGCFTYGLPPSTDNWRRAIGYGSDADALYGIALSPDIVWELTPWSWAVDWFTNTGDIVNNFTNFELAGQVMRYGYIMEETIDRVTATLSNTAFNNEMWRVGPLTSSVECVTKRRAPANPFGFGLTWEGMSPSQLLIAAALGITRLL